MATYWENNCSFGLRYVSLYKYLIVGLVFSHLGFWSGNLFLIAPFPDLCLLVPLNNHEVEKIIKIRYKHRLLYASPVPKIVPLSLTQANLCLKHKLLEDQVKKRFNY